MRADLGRQARSQTRTRGNGVGALCLPTLTTARYANEAASPHTRLTRLWRDCGGGGRGRAAGTTKGVCGIGLSGRGFLADRLSITPYVLKRRPDVAPFVGACFYRTAAPTTVYRDACPIGAPCRTLFILRHDFIQ